MPAQANSAAVDYFRSRADRTAVPTLLSQDDRTYYKNLFGAIEREDWNAVQQMLAQRADGPLHAVAKAQYYLAANSPKAELQPLIESATAGRTEHFVPVAIAGEVPGTVRRFAVSGHDGARLGVAA